MVFNAEPLWFQSPAHTERPQSSSLHPLPGGEEASHLHSLRTRLLLGVHHRVVPHQGQARVLVCSIRHAFSVLMNIPPKQQIFV